MKSKPSLLLTIVHYFKGQSNFTPPIESRAAEHTALNESK